MARVDNTLQESLKALIPYLQERLGTAEEFILHENQTEPPLEPTYQANRPKEYKLEVAKVVKSMRWFLNKYSLPTPPAFTDAEMDAEDLNVRTHET